MGAVRVASWKLRWWLWSRWRPLNRAVRRNVVWLRRRLAEEAATAQAVTALRAVVPGWREPDLERVVRALAQGRARLPRQVAWSLRYRITAGSSFTAAVTAEAISLASPLRDKTPEQILAWLDDPDSA